MNVAEDLSIQLYSLREYGDLSRQLAALADLGFKRVETVGGHLENAASTRTALDAHGIEAPTGHAALADLRNRTDWVVDQAHTLGIKELYMPAVAAEDRHGRDDEFWRALGNDLGEIATLLNEKGLALGYHNHHWELVPFTDGTTPLEHLFAGANGSALTFEADLAWLVRGQADPIAWMEREKSRLTAIHIKDLAPDGENLDEDGWADIGEGTLDWPGLFSAAQAHGTKWFVLEHDKPSDAVRFARSARVFALENFG